MTKNFNLQPLVDLTHHNHEVATRKLGQLNQMQQDAQSKLDTLLQYRKDYQARFQEATQNGMAPADLRNFQNFMNRLDEAVLQQREKMAQAHLSIQNGRDELINAQRKMKSFDTLAQRHAQAVRQQEHKLEQRTQDEYSGRFSAQQQDANKDQT